MKYFESLKERNLPKHDGKLAEDGINIRPYNSAKYDVGNGRILSYLVGDQLMCVKPNIGRFFEKEEIIDIVSGDYYNNVGALSLVSYPINIVYDSPILGGSYPAHGVATHNLKGIREIELCHGREIMDRLEGDIWASKYNWTILNDHYAKSYMLTQMTKDCYNDFINMFLADKFCAYEDRHYENYFFYRPRGEKLWQGVIAIDNGLIMPHRVASEFFEDKRMGRRIIECSDLNSWTPQGTRNYSSHSKNIREIKDLLEKGSFESAQEETIKKIIEYPYEDKLKSICAGYNIPTNQVYDSVARLWEYNREEMSR